MDTPLDWDETNQCRSAAGFQFGCRLDIWWRNRRDHPPNMRAAADVRQIILRIVTVIPLPNYRNSIGIIGWHWNGCGNRFPFMATFRDIRKITSRIIATFPTSFSDWRSRAGWRRHDGKSLPIMAANFHVRIVTARLIAVVPDGPRPRLAGSVVSTPKKLGWYWSFRFRWEWQTDDDAAVPTTAFASLPPATAPVAPMPVCLRRIIRGIGAREWVTHRGSHCPVQQDHHYGCCQRAPVHLTSHST